MRHPVIILFAFLLVAFYSCQKEYSFDGGGSIVPPPGGTTGLLQSALMKNTSSELSYEYTYTSANEPQRNVLSITTSSLLANYSVRVTRNATGQISNSTVIFASNQSATSDTLDYEFVRNSAGKIIRSLARYNVGSGFDGYDSTLYSYDGAGKLIGFITYYIEPSAGINEPYQKMDFTYTGNNVTKSMEYELNGTVSNQTLLETINYTYDDKPAARILTADEYIASLAPVNLQVPAVNNMTRSENIDPTDPSATITMDYNYTYGTNNKPTSANITTTLPGLPPIISTLTFTYN